MLMPGLDDVLGGSVHLILARGREVSVKLSVTQKKVNSFSQNSPPPPPKKNYPEC